MLWNGLQLAIQGPTPPEHNDVHIQWSVRPPGVCKVNTDGSKINAFGLIGVGGLLRDSFRNWIKGFTMNLGDGFIVEYELWGIFYGINLAWDTGFRMVEVECDSNSAVVQYYQLLYFEDSGG